MRKKAVKRLFLFFIITVLLTSIAFSQDTVSVSLPTISVSPVDILILPVIVSDLTSLEVTSVQMIISFSDTVLRAQGSSYEGTLLQDWGQPTVNVSQPGLINLGAFGISPLNGEGILINFIFEIIGEPNDSSHIFIESIVFNQGEPYAKDIPGLVIIESFANVIITSNYPNDTKVIVDGVSKQVPFDTLWTINTEHVLGVESPQLYATGSRFVFSSWSDGEDQLHTIVPISDTVYYANFINEYELVVETAPPNLVEITGSGWYQKNSEITIGEAPQNITIGDSTYEFIKWELDNISQEGPFLIIIMDSTHTAIAKYRAFPVRVHYENPSILIDRYYLYQNYPNPFNPTTQINVDLPKASDVTIEIYNLRGQKVRTLVDGLKDAGSHSIQFDATDDEGNKLPTGIYLYMFRTNEYQEIRKLTIMK